MDWVYRSPPSRPKRGEEALELAPFLLCLEQSITLDDVESGQDPPDFVFRHQAKRIGVELTALVPTLFDEGGYLKRADFKTFQAETKEPPLPKHEFEWGEFTLRESLDAFAMQLDRKTQKVKVWGRAFSENWLLMHVACGSPFGVLVASERRDMPGDEAEMADFAAKTAHAVSLMCRKSQPFRYVILFSGTALLAFPANDSNPHRLPTPSADLLDRGANAFDEYLDWRSRLSSIVEHPLLASETESGIPTT